MESLNIIQLIEKNPIIRLSKVYESKFIQKIQTNFTETQQNIFVGSFYCYLNYNCKVDFVIDLESVWKWLGFERKDFCKKLLKKNFILDIDYKITVNNLAPPAGEASLNIEKHGGSNKETILLTVNTFKKLCLKSNTKKADEIHDYFIKLEETLQEVVNEESTELRNQVQQKEQEIKQKDTLLIKQNTELIKQKETIDLLENKPDTCGFERTSGYVYFISDTTKPGHIKIGNTTTLNDRVSGLNVSSSTYSLKIIAAFDTYDKEFLEKLIHCALNPFRIKSRGEWFYFRNNNEMVYALNTATSCMDFIKKFNINELPKIKEIDLNELLDDLNKNSDGTNKIAEIKQIHKEKVKKTIIKNAQKIPKRTWNFKGTTFMKERNQWRADIQHDNERFCLGYYKDEVDAAKVWNNFCLFLNQTKNAEFILNDIPGYITVAENIPEKNKSIKLDTKSSQFTGVSYLAKMDYFVGAIKCSTITYNLGTSKCENEIAHRYNCQAMYFNNTLNTNYTYNVIEDKNYITIPKNVSAEFAELRINNKTSKYYGVTFSKKSKMWSSGYTMNQKKIHLGSFKTEIEACTIYNDTVIKLNENGFKYKVNIL